MPSHRWFPLAAISFAVALAANSDLASAQQRRSFQVDDLFELESMGRYYGGPYAFGPGGVLALTRVRAKKHLADHKLEYLWGNAGGDVWVQLDPSADPVNVTRGIEDGSGWWAPSWSPDGRWLAMLSTRGGEVRLWAWSVETGELRPLTDRNVDLRDVLGYPFLWVDEEQLLVPLLPEDERPLGMEIELQTPRIATEEWPKVRAGREVTASVLESGVPVDLDRRPQGRLDLVHVRGGARTLVEGTARTWRISSDGVTIAFTRQLDRYVPRAGEALGFGSEEGERAGVELAVLGGAAPELTGDVSEDVLESSLRWSPDGRTLAFLGYRGGRTEPPLLYRADARTGTVFGARLPGLDAGPIVREQAQLFWTAGGGLIVRARLAGEGPASERARQDWYYLAPGSSSPQRLTGKLEIPPARLWPVTGRRTFVGVATGRLWEVTPEAGSVRALTQADAPRIQSLAWPTESPAGDAQAPVPGVVYDEVVAVESRDSVEALYRVDLTTGRTAPLVTPAEGAALVAYEPAFGTGIFARSDRSGLGVWRLDPAPGRARRLVDGNAFLRGIEDGDLRPIEYTSLNGDSLSGWVLLPVGYEPGQRYPLLTWVYPGSVQGNRPSPYLTSISSGSSLNMQIPAANGYAVLLPSMPLAPEGEVDDPMLRLQEGVLPAVDRVVALGIADPDRLYLAGQSFGGYATYGLITQTHRFAAAAALAGLSNLVSLYGQFGARERYTETAHETLFMMALMESAQVRLGGPPWSDLGRYIRNSPVFFVDRVETPLLIVQGDLDYVALQQGEEFFTGLYRQGKRARFVRYWGEGHVLESPANIRHMWRELFTWFAGRGGS